MANGLMQMSQQGAVDQALSQEAEAPMDPEMNRIGMGTEPASPEEQKQLDSFMDAVEDLVHGDGREDIVSLLGSMPDLFQSVGFAAVGILDAGYNQAGAQGLEIDPSIFYGENGAIQQTVEMLWEVADAVGHPASQDEEQFSAALFNTYKLVGEQMFEENDQAAMEAQSLMIDAELGEPLSEKAHQQFNMAETAEVPSNGQPI